MFKVLMYGWEFPPHISGGLGVACHGIVNGLADHELDISLVLPCVETDTLDPEHIHFYDCRHSAHEFSVHSLNRLNKIVNVKSIKSWLTPYITSEFSKNLFADHQFIEKFLKTNRENFYQFQGKYGADLLSEVMRYAIIAGAHARDIEHDIIHAHDWLTILAGIEAKLVSGKPLIFHVHALETDRNSNGMNQVIFDIEKYGMIHADKIIAVSQYTKDCIIKNYGIEAEKIKVAHNGISAEQIQHKNLPTSSPKNNNLVLFLGRVTHQKGPYFFLQAAKKILSTRQDIEFVMAGDGDLWKDMIHIVANWRLGSYIHFTKFLTKSFAEEVFRRSKVFVMPSISEPFGLACLEAISKQVPVILSKQSGVAEVMNHCLKVDFWDTDKIANYIVQLIDNSTLAQHITAHSFAELPNLLWSKQVKKIIDVYSELAAYSA